MDESAIVESPTPPVAGPSSSGTSMDEVFRGFDVDGFDWKAFEGTYKGRALITRLLHIPKILLAKPATTDPKLLEFARTAILRAVPLIKQTWDTNLYMQVMEQYNQTLGRSTGRLNLKDDDDEEGEEDGDEPMSDSVGDLGSTGNEAECKLDTTWIARTREEEKREVTRTDVELRGYMSNLIKESIRLTHLSFARMAVKSGNIGDVIKHHASAREFAGSPAHHVEQGISLIESCLLFNNTSPLSGVLGKVEAAADRVYAPPTSSARGTAGQGSTTTLNEVREGRERDAKAAGARKDVKRTIRIAKGLLALEQGSFRHAATEFAALLEDGGLGRKEGEAISTSDVAMITAMCTMATGSRDTIQDVLLNRSSFRSAVDDNQQWLLDAVRLYADAQYGDTKSSIHHAIPTLMLNPFLSSHVEALFKAINNRAIIQYIQPFSTVSLTSMSTATGIALDPLLLEIEDLLEKGQVKGRIDLIDMILYIREADPRRDAYQSAFKVGGAINVSTRAAIVRMRLHEAKIEVDPRDPASKGLALGPSDPLELNEDESRGLGLPEYTATTA